MLTKMNNTNKVFAYIVLTAALFVAPNILAYDNINQEIPPVEKSVTLNENVEKRVDVKCDTCKDTTVNVVEPSAKKDIVVRKRPVNRTTIEKNVVSRSKCLREIGDSNVYGDCDSTSTYEPEQKVIVKENIEKEDRCLKELGDSSIFESCDDEDNEGYENNEDDNKVSRLDEDEGIGVKKESLPGTGTNLPLVILPFITIVILIKLAKGFRRKNYETL